MTDPHEGDVYRHPSAGEDVIIDYVTDAEVCLRVTRLRELRGAPEVEAEHVAVSRGGSPATRDLSESVAHGPEDGPCETGRCGARISATHRCQLDYGHAGECAG